LPKLPNCKIRNIYRSRFLPTFRYDDQIKVYVLGGLFTACTFTIFNGNLKERKKYGDESSPIGWKAEWGPVLISCDCSNKHQIS
jgi:hypothetical protein